VDCTKKIDAPELCSPSEATRLQITIERDKNKAIQNYDGMVKQVACLNLYTDGSAKDGKVGADLMEPKKDKDQIVENGQRT
jgi:hypothetical protein